ncbi:MAG: hypothetical protein KGJ84_01105 [Elusimicrobia bacterium]|nr:hypothetical protein [Elusimicrobiota bacterium]
MILLVVVFAVLAAAFAAEAARLTRILAIASRQLAESQRRLAPPPPPPPPPPPILFECRREENGLLWFPVLTAKADEKQVVGVSSGLPHCTRCVRPLKVLFGRTEEWVCSACEARHPAAAADLRATDLVLTECLREFFARHPDFAPAPGLSAPKVETPVAA